MTATINILIAIFGLTGTLAAFGGETWRKGDEVIFKRITKRGYLSLSCLLITFTLGIVKEIRTNIEKSYAQNENKFLVTKIAELQDSLLKQSKEVTVKAKEVSVKVDEFVRNNCEGVEKAFKLAQNIPREYDDCMLTLTGESAIILPGRKSNPMEIYWGDRFEFSVFEHGYKGTVEDLGTLKLKVHDHEYPLHSGHGNLYFHNIIRIIGHSPLPMTAVILNPKNLKGVGFKIFVNSTDATRGQVEFKRAVLQGSCAEYAKKIYKVINQDIVRLRSRADVGGSVLSTLSKGSFVRTLQKLDDWTEVITPEDRQGWIKSEFLSTIQ